MTDRAALLEQMDSARAELDARLDRIDEAHGSWVGAAGDWSVAQLLQHLHGWLTVTNSSVERLLNGLPPIPEDADFSDIDAWNAGFLTERGEQSYADARAAYAAAHDHFRANVARVDPQHFGDDQTLNQMVTGTVIGHYPQHIAQLDEFLGASHD